MVNSSAKLPNFKNLFPAQLASESHGETNSSGNIVSFELMVTG